MTCGAQWVVYGGRSTSGEQSRTVTLQTVRGDRTSRAAHSTPHVLRTAHFARFAQAVTLDPDCCCDGAEDYLVDVRHLLRLWMERMVELCSAVDAHVALADARNTFEVSLLPVRRLLSVAGTLPPGQAVGAESGGGGGERHTMPHSAQPQHTNYWAPRTRKRHQQEHRPQRPTESSDLTQHAKGRTGDCPGPRKGATTRRNVTQGGGGGAEANKTFVSSKSASSSQRPQWILFFPGGNLF